VYQSFWEDQHGKLEELTRWLDLNIPVLNNDARARAHRQISILDEYEKYYQRILAKTSLTKDQHAAYVKKQASDFYNFIKMTVNTVSVTNAAEIKKLIGALFANLQDQDYLAARQSTDLHRCQDRLIARANEKIADAKFEVKLIHAVAKVYESSSSISSSSSMDDEDALSEPVAVDVRAALQTLLQTIKAFDLEQHPEVAHFVFRVDRMYLELERQANKARNIYLIENRKKLIELIDTTIDYLAKLQQVGTSASKKFAQQAERFINSHLLQEIIRSGNYQFNEARGIPALGLEEIMQRVSNSLSVLIANEEKRSGFLYRWFGDDTLKIRAKRYLLLLSKCAGQNAEALKLSVLLALFKNANSNQLRFSVLKDLLGLDPEENKIVTELDVLVMREILEKMLTDKIQTQQISLLDSYADRILQAIDRPNGDPLPHFDSLQCMLNQLNALRKSTPEYMISQAIKGLAVHKENVANGAYDSLSSSSSSFGGFSSSSSSLSSSLFKPAPKAVLVHETILHDPNANPLIRLSIVYALLTSRKDQNLSGVLTGVLSPESTHNLLRSTQIAEHIENVLKKYIPAEKLGELPALMHKLIMGINSGSKLEKELVRLTDMFALQASIEEEKVCGLSA